MPSSNRTRCSPCPGAPVKSLYGRFAKIFKEKAEAAAKGSVKVKIRCCNQISTEDNGFKAMQLGTVDGFFITANNVSPHWPLMDVTVLPYIFQNTKHLEKVVDGPVGTFMKDQLQKDTSVHLLTFGPALYRDFYNSKRAINTMADMEGLKIRAPKNEVMLATFEAFGAEPVPLAWSETPTALQTGTVDGGDNGTSFIKDMKFFEFKKHLVILEHFVAMAPLFASNAFMNRLSDEQRGQVLAAAEEAGAAFRKQVLTETEDVRKWLSTEGGMAMTRPDRADSGSGAAPVNSLLILAIVFVVLTIIGMPLFVAVGLTTALALFLIDIPYTLMAQTGYTSLTPFPLLTIPLFVLAGRLMETGGMAKRMISIATNLVGAYRGSMGMVTVFACMLFAALSGSGPATTAAIGSVTVPAMKRDGYDVPFAAAITASAGALGSLIPPSNLMIIYGLVSETSIPRAVPGGAHPRRPGDHAADGDDLSGCA